MLLYRMHILFKKKHSQFLRVFHRHSTEQNHLEIDVYSQAFRRYHESRLIQFTCEIPTVAQWLARLPAVPVVMGPNPLGGEIFFIVVSSQIDPASNWNHEISPKVKAVYNAQLQDHPPTCINLLRDTHWSWYHTGLHKILLLLEIRIC